jgi:uncharacterized protein YqeY
MTIEVLEKARDTARKAGDKARVVTLNDVIAAVRKAETAGKKKVELTETMVNEALMGYRKMLKDGIAAAPVGSVLHQTYTEQLGILMEYCPPVLEDEIEIENLITKTLYTQNIPIGRKTKGQMMKALMPVLRAQYADMEVAMPLIEFMIAEAEKANG